jgi:hypothetical protein
MAWKIISKPMFWGQNTLPTPSGLKNKPSEQETSMNAGGKEYQN